MSWKDVAADNYICYCMRVTKKEIIQTINQGARTIDEVKKTTGACTGEKCGVTNPTGRCCCGDVQEMIDFYAPLADALRR